MKLSVKLQNKITFFTLERPKRHAIFFFLSIPLHFQFLTRGKKKKVKAYSSK